MFYSQFILAKKGPLGTIWIAAHLERKLRKNQVADTDIGVSVDSIIFPDVPIALRLSSHLLLGVVRIYSRKVNYLFDDCSEALLKVKQAFRSTAVDLPPEESTAPYHSITLPETFDLDDFELPDNEIYQGNYVDHHISSREQITLQDTMEGVVYSTSQFGLDERFGDGDASLIGLDLDEELFLDKVATHEGVPDVNPEASEPVTPLEMNDKSDEIIAETSEPVLVNLNGDQNEVLAASTEVVEYAQAPSTPGLVEEPNLSSVQEALACDDHLESEDHNVLELVEGSEKIATSNLDHYVGDNDKSRWSSHNGTNGSVHSEENGYLSSDIENKLVKPERDLPSTVSATEHMLEEGTGALDGREDACNVDVINKDCSTLCIDQMNVDYDARGDRIGDNIGAPSCVFNNDPVDPSHKTSSSGALALRCLVEDQTSLNPSCNAEEMLSPSEAKVSDACLQESPFIPEAEVINAECQSNEESKDTGISESVSPNEMPFVEKPWLQACNSVFGRPEKPYCGGEKHHVNDGTKLGLEKDIYESAFSGGNQTECRDSDRQLDNRSDIQLANLNSSITSELSAPEKLLSVPEDLSGRNNLFLNLSTPDKDVVPENDVDGAGINVITGKKRSFTESTLTMQSLNSVESIGVAGYKNTTESIPDDDDLLSSILVGRRSSVLKMKLTPPAPEITSMKRPRSTVRSSTTKRKVLIDDTMVLHGDMIREQLTSTEDIRRVRKKAPCTRPEILMIQRQYLEDGIFSEPIFTGTPSELILVSEKLDLSGIVVTDNYQDDASSEVRKDVDSIARPNVTGEIGTGEDVELLIVGNDLEAQATDFPIQMEAEQAGEFNLVSHNFGTQGLAVTIEESLDVKTPQDEHPEEIAEMETERVNIKLLDTANESIFHGVESPSTAVKDKSKSVYPDDADVPLQMDASCFSPERRLEFEPVLDAGTLDMRNIKGGIDISVDHNAELGGDVYMDCTEPIASLATIISENDGFKSYNDDRPTVEMRNANLGIINEDEIRFGDLESDSKDPSSSYLADEGAKIDISHTVGLDVHVKSASCNDCENPECAETDVLNIMGTEIPVPDHFAVDDHGAFEEFPAGNDTEFLNVDDDEVADEDEESIPGGDETRLVENTGWSSRTRAVAKYLQAQFEKDSVSGRNVLSMDSLLVGKSRKEASRMFFETLVLKTRDYIHVEQPEPFDNIILKPRVKLVKSDF